MSKYKEYNKVLKSEHIDNDRNFSYNFEYFLKHHQNIKIIQTIVHKPYHVTIIYEELIPVN